MVANVRIGHRMRSPPRSRPRLRPPPLLDLFWCLTRQVRRSRIRSPRVRRPVAGYYLTISLAISWAHACALFDHLPLAVPSALSAKRHRRASPCRSHPGPSSTAAQDRPPCRPSTSPMSPIEGSCSPAGFRRPSARAPTTLRQIRSEWASVRTGPRDQDFPAESPVVKDRCQLHLRRPSRSPILFEPQVFWKAASCAACSPCILRWREALASRAR